MQISRCRPAAEPGRRVREGDELVAADLGAVVSRHGVGQPQAVRLREDADRAALLQRPGEGRATADPAFPQDAAPAKP